MRPRGQKSTATQDRRANGRGGAGLCHELNRVPVAVLGEEGDGGGPLETTAQAILGSRPLLVGGSGVGTLLSKLPHAEWLEES